MKRLLFLCLIIILPVKGQAQFKINNNKDVFLFNVISGGIIGGIGSMINKNNEKTYKAFFKGFYKGALGGTLVYGGKQMLSNFSRTHNYSNIWASKVLVYSGISMIENAASNKKLLSDLHLNLFLFRIDYRADNQFVFRPRAMLFSILNTGYTIIKYDMHINPKISLWTGIPVFSDNKIMSKNSHFKFEGMSIGNSIWVTGYQTNFPFEMIMSHELTHVYQYNMFSSTNNYFSITNIKLGKTKLYNKLTKYFYLNYGAIFYNGFYYLTSEFYKDNYFNNPFEGEAAVISLQNKISKH